MRIETGRIETKKIPELPQTQPKTERSGEPPRRRTAIDAGFSGNGADIPPGIRRAFGDGEKWAYQPTEPEAVAAVVKAMDEEIEVELSDRTSKPWLLRELDRISEKYCLFPYNASGNQVGHQKLNAFLDKLKNNGFIKKKKLGIKEYIGALLPWRKV